MGNSLVRWKKKVKVMKITGETIKLKTPIHAGDILKDYPLGYVLLDSDSVKQMGVRAVPLDHHQLLKPNNLYFLLDLPKFTHHLNVDDDDDVWNKAPRRVKSGIHLTAKDRLECLMLSRRSVSDLTVSRTGRLVDAGPSSPAGSVSMRVKMRLTRAQMDKLVQESKDQTEVAHKVLDLYMQMEKATINSCSELLGPEKPPMVAVDGLKAHEKRVRFTPMEEEGALGC